jgi:hypothetical protein
MTHEEVSDGSLMRTWTAIDERNVLTAKEAWRAAKADGWLLDYHRYVEMNY